MDYTEIFNKEAVIGNWWWLLAFALVVLAAFGVLLWWVLFADYKSTSTSAGTSGGGTKSTSRTNTITSGSSDAQSTTTATASKTLTATPWSSATPVQASTSPTPAPVSSSTASGDRNGGSRVSSAQLDSIISTEFAGEDVVVHEPLGILYRSAPQAKDNLQDIKGVGPVLEKKLNEIGVFRFKQIANWPEAAIDEFQDQLSFPDRIRRDDWISQAISLAKGINPNK